MTAIPCEDASTSAEPGNHTGSSEPGNHTGSSKTEPGNHTVDSKSSVPDAAEAPSSQKWSADNGDMRMRMIAVVNAYGQNALQVALADAPHAFLAAATDWCHLLTPVENAALTVSAINMQHAREAAGRIDLDRPSDSTSEQETQLLVNMCVAEQRFQDVSTLLAQRIEHAFVPGFLYDPGGNDAFTLAIHSLQPSVQRRFVPKRIGIDVMSGHQSLGKYQTALDTGSIVISLDQRERDDALSEIPQHLWARIIYIKMDVADLTYDELIRIIVHECKLDPRDVYIIHFSMDCRTFSTADCGKTGYRLLDGKPNPHARSDLYQLACEHDAILSTVLATLHMFAQQYTRTLISCENPVGAWEQHESVQHLSAQPNWQLIEVHYCKCADPKWDGDRVFTQKPTKLLLHACKYTTLLQNALCQRDCRFRFPDHTGMQHYHLRSIRIDHKSPPGQQKQIGTLRHAIPGGLFNMLFLAHEEWLAENPVSARTHRAHGNNTQMVNITTRSGKDTLNRTLAVPRQLPLPSSGWLAKVPVPKLTQPASAPKQKIAKQSMSDASHALPAPQPTMPIPVNALPAPHLLARTAHATTQPTQHLFPAQTFPRAFPPASARFRSVAVPARLTHSNSARIVHRAIPRPSTRSSISKSSARPLVARHAPAVQAQQDPAQHA